jgi:SAM-dependent methyltransferase
MSLKRSENSALSRPEIDDLEKISELQKYVLHLDNLSGTYYPTALSQQESAVSYSDTLPVPPQEFWHWYANNEADYLELGRLHAEKYKSTARSYGFDFAPGKRVLDFGCSGGRVTRWFTEEAAEGIEIWGCDIDAAAIEWCQKNMMPPFRFFANTTAPHLPVRDGYFDFIFAGSVFTHIKDMSAAWGLELARCLSPDGLAILTITSERSLPALAKVAAADVQKAKKVPQFVVENNVDEAYLRKRGFVTLQSSPWQLAALYHTDFFIRRMSLGFECVGIIDNLKGYQTGMVLRRRD